LHDDRAPADRHTVSALCGEPPPRGTTQRKRAQVNSAGDYAVADHPGTYHTAARMAVIATPSLRRASAKSCRCRPFQPPTVNRLRNQCGQCAALIARPADNTKRKRFASPRRPPLRRCHAPCGKKPRGTPAPPLAVSHYVRPTRRFKCPERPARVHSAVHPVPAALRALREPTPDRSRAPAPPSHRGSCLTPASWLRCADYPPTADPLHEPATARLPCGADTGLRLRSRACPSGHFKRLT
jgi:hypothetical protein